MRLRSILVLFLLSPLYGQITPAIPPPPGGQTTVGTTVDGSVSTTGATGSFSLLPVFLTAGIAQLPLNWGDDQECDPPGGIYDVTRVMGVNYPATSAGYNLAILDYYGAPDQNWALQLPFGTYNTGSPLAVTSQITLLGKPNATKCLTFIGTGAITPSQVPCSHKVQDNNDGSSPRNLGCTNDIAQYATLEGRWNSGNNGMLFTACQVGVDANCTVGPNHYAFKFMEPRFQAGNSYSGQKVKMFNLNDGDQTGLLGSNHIWFIGNYFHGDASDAGTGSNLISSVIDFTSCSYCGQVWNYFDKVMSTNNESHIITATWSPGPLKFAQFWCEGASMCLFYGGAASTVLPYENVFDTELRSFRATKPPAWMTLPAGTPCTLCLKSDVEVKTATRMLIDGCILENSNTSGGQKGQALTLTPRNTSGGASGDNYLNSIDNINVTNCVIRHTVTGIESASRSDGPGNGGGSTVGGFLWNVYNILGYDISPGTGTILNATVNIPFFVELGGGGNSWTATAIRDATGQFATLTPADGGAGLHKTMMNVSDFVHVKSCSDTNFNTPIHNVSFAGQGPPALAGTQSFILSGGLPIPGPIVYANVGTPNATATGCVVSNEQGFPSGYSVRHVSVFGGFTGASGGKGQIPSCLSIDAYSKFFTFQDNLVLPLPAQYAGLNCQGNGNTEGSVSEANMFNPLTGTFNHNVIGPPAAGTSRNLALYTDYPSGVTPSVANWNPKNIVCPAATADIDCVGVTNMMSGGSYQANGSTIDGYALVPSSFYAAGGSRQASDGLQVGADVAAIKSHLIQTQYTCLTPCGPLGPNPD